MNYLKYFFFWVGILAFLGKLQRSASGKYRGRHLYHRSVWGYVFLLNHFNNFLPFVIYTLPSLGSAVLLPVRS